MLISIWGRDGSGKSTLADHLGSLLARDTLAAVIDTDLTQPTLPVRLSGTNFKRERSLGRAIAGTGAAEAIAYLHPHSDIKGLFYAGLLNGDDYLSFEIGLEAELAADLFIRKCQDAVDHVILDCSGQRTDPFVPIGLQTSDLIFILLTPDLQGNCWWQAIEPLLRQLNIADKVRIILSPVQRFHQAAWIGDGIKSEIQCVLPFAPELQQLRCSASPTTQVVTRGGRYWLKAAWQIYHEIIRTGSDAS